MEEKNETKVFVFAFKNKFYGDLETADVKEEYEIDYYAKALARYNELVVSGDYRNVNMYIKVKGYDYSLTNEYTRTNPVKEDITDEQLVNLISAATEGNPCWYFEYDDNVYAESRQHLLNDGYKKEDLCWEDVIARMLEDGVTLKMIDAEGEDDDENATIDLKSINERGREYLHEQGCESWEEFVEEGDLCSAASLMETCSTWKEALFF